MVRGKITRYIPMISMAARQPHRKAAMPMIPDMGQTRAIGEGEGEGMNEGMKRIQVMVKDIHRHEEDRVMIMTMTPPISRAS